MEANKNNNEAKIMSDSMFSDNGNIGCRACLYTFPGLKIKYEVKYGDLFSMCPECHSKDIELFDEAKEIVITERVCASCLKSQKLELFKSAKGRCKPCRIAFNKSKKKQQQQWAAGYKEGHFEQQAQV